MRTPRVFSGVEGALSNKRLLLSRKTSGSRAALAVTTLARAAESQRRSMKESVKTGLRPGRMRSGGALGTQPLGWISPVVRERYAG